MQKPPCQKCGAKNVYLVPPRTYTEEPSIACYVCGWRCYGEEKIRALIVSHNEEVILLRKQQAELRKLEEKARLELERQIAEREAQQREAQRLAQEKEKEERAFRLLQEGMIPGYPFKPGDIDPVLHVPWAGPVIPGTMDSCAWPPCESRARSNSRYCSRACTVKVARRRDRLRKKGLLQQDKKAS